MTTGINVAIMVKDEENTILKTLLSLGPHVKKLYILDTGSVDSTVNIIIEYCNLNNVPLLLKQLPMVDFSYNRNYMLDFVEEDMALDDEFIMVLDSNDELKATWDFTAKLNIIPKQVNCIITHSSWVNEDQHDTPHISTTKTFIIRARRNVRYIMRVHECLVVDGIPINYHFMMDGVTLFQDRKDENEKSQSRSGKDLVWLMSDLKDHKGTPYESRIMYYIARTHIQRREYPDAIKYLEQFMDLASHIDINDFYDGTLMYCQILFEHFDDHSKIPHYLLNAYNTMPKRTDALTTLTTYYVKKGKWHNAFHFARLACEKTLDIESSRCVNVIDFYINRWYLLVVAAINIGDITTARDALKHIDIETVKKYGCTPEIAGKIDMLRFMCYPFYDMIGEDKKIILVFGGQSYGKWDGSMINKSTGLGGSETVCTYISTYLNKKQDLPVFVCCDTDSYKYIGGIFYFPMDFYESFVSLYNIEHLIVFRFATFLRYYPNVKNCILFLEDILPVGTKLGEIDMEYNDKLRYIVCKTEWHKKTFLAELQRQLPDVHCQVVDKIRVIGNAIEPDRFKMDKTVKKPWRFVYSSCPTRGAWNMVRLMPKIKQMIPQAEFHFFITYESPYYKPEHKIDELKIELEKLRGYVFVHPRVSQKELAIEMLKSDIWIYPTTFPETYCITALEMQMARVLCIYSNPSCLTEIIGDRGILTKCDVDEVAYDDEVLGILRGIMIGDVDKDGYLKRAYEWAVKQTWERRVDEVIELI